MIERIFIPIFVISIFVMIGIALILGYWIKNKDGTFKEPDYRLFFIIGISYLPMGIIFSILIHPAFISFLAFSIIYMAICIANLDKWKTT